MGAEIERLSGKVVYQNRWMTVREDQVRFANGHEGIYGVVDKPDFVLIVPVHADGRIQMVQQYRYPVGGRFWELPQGSWETDPGADPVEIARGELEEETGYRAGNMKPVGHLFEAYGFSNQGFHIYLATDLTAGQLRRDVEEQGMETAAFSLKDLTDMIRQGTLKDAPTIAALGILRLTGEI